MHFSARQDILVGSTKWNFLLQWPFIWAIIATVLVNSVIPMASWAATIEGTKFIDVHDPSGTPGQFDLGIDIPLPNQVILLKKEGSSPYSLPSVRVTDQNGKYTFEGLSLGTYRVWQRVRLHLDDPFTSYENAHRVTITGSNQVVSFIGFPIPQLEQKKQDFIDEQLEKVDEICGDSNDPNMIEDTFENVTSDSIVKINKNEEVAVPSATNFNGKGVRVKALCNYGTLYSGSGNEVTIRAIELIANYGSIYGFKMENQELIERGKNSSDYLPGSAPYPKANPPESQNDGGNGIDVILSVSTDHPAGGCHTGSTDPTLFYNAETGIIQAGQGGAGYLKGGKGGDVAIPCANTIIQAGQVIAGKGGEGNAHQPEWDADNVKFNGESLAKWDWKPGLLPSYFTDNNNIYYYANVEVRGGKGGGTLIETGRPSNEDQIIMTPSSQLVSGTGGQAGVWCNDHPDKGHCWLEDWNTEDDPRWYTGTCHCDPGVEKAEPKPGDGGDLTVDSGNVVISGTADSGGSIYFEPEIMLSWPNLRVQAKEDVVIFGGDNWELNLNYLSDGAITAGRNIILAVGDGGKINLQGNNSKVFKAIDGKVEIYADTVLTDDGIQLEDLVETNEIVLESNKILHHVTLTGQQQIRGIPGETLPMEIILANGGPTSDSYTLNVSDSEGWELSGVPSSTSVEALGQKNFILTVTLPQKLGIRDIITITATSQTIPDVEAIMKIIVNTTCRVWGIQDSELNHSQLFEIHSNDLQTFDVINQGGLYENYDLESLDMNPLTGVLYLASSTHANHPGLLYEVNLKENAGMKLIGDIGFQHVDSLSFDSQGVLWGWERGEGLLQIDLLTGVGKLITPYTEDVQDISWSPDGKLLYAVQGTDLLVWDGNTLTTQCVLHGEIEGIEAITENMLMFGIHGSKKIRVIDVENGCQEVSNIPIPFNDVEGIAWSADTCPIQ